MQVGPTLNQMFCRIETAMGQVLELTGGHVEKLVENWELRGSRVRFCLNYRH